MKKKIYQQPEMKVVELEQMDVICTSNESLGDGGNIFGGSGARGGDFYDEDE